MKQAAAIEAETMDSNRTQQGRTDRSSPGRRLPSTKLSVMALAACMIGGISLARAQDEALKPETINNTRNMRFCEILIVKVLKGIEVYNTTGVSDCSPQLWNTLDLAEIRSHFDALKAEKNGPHFWMMDSQTVLFGERASFGGIEARWVARLPLLTALEAATGSKPYHVFEPKKTQRMVYSKGKPVYELIDPDNNVYVLQAHEERFPIDSLDKMGEQLKMPAGWKFRARDLNEDLILDLKPGQTIYAVGDEYHQYWTRIPK
jgi:hypothetical protein